jgi:hypothetical protein
MAPLLQETLAMVHRDGVLVRRVFDKSLASLTAEQRLTLYVLAGFIVFSAVSLLHTYIYHNLTSLQIVSSLPSVSQGADLRTFQCQLTPIPHFTRIEMATYPSPMDSF